jgi:hypothetical protein
MYLPTADGARCLSDAVQEAVRIVNLGRGLRGAEPIAPKGGARFHFEAPGAVQGFESQSPGLTLENVSGHSLRGTRSLALHYSPLTPHAPLRVATPTFIRPEDLNMGGYPLHASPTLYPGQIVRARVAADEHNRASVTAALCLSVYGANDGSRGGRGPLVTLAPGTSVEVQWTMGEFDGQPIHAIGLEVSGAAEATVYLDELTWEGAPTVTFRRPTVPGTAWHRAWVSAVDQFPHEWPEPFRPIQNEGRGLLIQGAREWQGYRVEADVKPLLCAAAGLAAYVQGLRRYYALLLAPDGKLRLIKMLEHERVLAESDFAWALEQPYHLTLEVNAGRLHASVNGQRRFEVTDADSPLTGGAIALVVEAGCFSSHAVTVRPSQIHD